jgi:hypothetical protein
MDLTSNRVVQRHEFNSSLLRPATNLASVTVDISNSECNNAFGYIPDLGGFGLIVYSLRENRAWRVNHNYFFPEPTSGEFSIGGHEFQWNDGVFSVALSDVKSDGYKDVYFHSMAGFNLYRVSTRIFKNDTVATRSYHGRDFEVGAVSGGHASDNRVICRLLGIEESSLRRLLLTFTPPEVFSFWGWSTRTLWVVGG